MIFNCFAPSLLKNCALCSQVIWWHFNKKSRCKDGFFSFCLVFFETSDWSTSDLLQYLLSRSFFCLTTFRKALDVERGIPRAFGNWDCLGLKFWLCNQGSFTPGCVGGTTEDVRDWNWISSVQALPPILYIILEVLDIFFKWAGMGLIGSGSCFLRSFEKGVRKLLRKLFWNLL